MIRRSTILSSLAVVVAGVVVGLGIFAIVQAAEPVDSSAAPVVAPQTSFPALAPPVGEPELTSIDSIRPTAGEVLQANGPFDDRFVFEDLAFDGTSVIGAVRITSDVSELLDLQVVAGFYDAEGQLLGTSRFVHHSAHEEGGHEGPPELREEFTVAIPEGLGGSAVSAAVGVPVLVNE